uniref:Uncharacterized protein LOC104216016 n=1 Tax=Nicotiana sylvestris TaxID=4096 RepID=A0A1U7VPK5_NICSY|nr:PREDICTED: uncharacterized protein LOC104216016 [Nicotiana sylvestris]
MKGSCTLVASMLAASTVAISSTSYSSSSADPDFTCHSASTEGVGYSSLTENPRSENSRKLPLRSEKEKFTPRFDGLRFIETLITAHR